jgi:hypothetical protein
MYPQLQPTNLLFSLSNLHSLSLMSSFGCFFQNGGWSPIDPTTRHDGRRYTDHYPFHRPPPVQLNEYQRIRQGRISGWMGQAAASGASGYLSPQQEYARRLERQSRRHDGLVYDKPGARRYGYGYVQMSGGRGGYW